MKTIYVLYGKKACKLYDISFEKLHSTKYVKFKVAAYKTNALSKLLNNINNGVYFRLITVEQYGMLLKVIDDKTV